MFLGEELNLRGYALIDITDDHHDNRSTLIKPDLFTKDELLSLMNYEDVFYKAFQLSTEVKDSEDNRYSLRSGNVTIGYRCDDEREFFETRYTVCMNDDTCYTYCWRYR